MKKLTVVIIGILAVLLIASFMKDALIKTSVEKGVEIITGLPLKMGSMHVGILRTLVGIKDLNLYNPQGYPDKIMLNMPEIYVSYDLPAIIKGVIHLKEMRIDMKEFVVVKNQKGELNLDSLKVVKAQKQGAKPGSAAKGKTPELQIDELSLKIGKVVFKDYSAGAQPIVKEFNVNLNEKYQNITDPYSLVSLIVVKSLMNTSIAGLTNFDLKGLQGTVSNTLASAQKITTQAVAEAQKTATDAAKKAQAAAQKSQEAAKQTQENLLKTTDQLKNIKLPFGGNKQ